MLSSDDKAIFKNFQISKDSLLLTDNRIEYQVGNIFIDGLYTNSFNNEYFEAFKFIIKYYDVKKIEYIPYKTNPKWPNWENYTSYEELIRNYTSFLKSEEHMTSKEDIEEIKELIKELEPELELEIKERDYMAKYQELFQEVRNIMNDPAIKTHDIGEEQDLSESQKLRLGGQNKLF